LQRSARYSEWIVVGAPTVLALLLRVVALGDVPPGVRYDELVNVEMADHIYAGEWPIYFREAWGHEPLYHYLHALGMRLLGKTVLGVRVTSALLGTLGVLSAYLVFRRLFGRGTAILAALLLATSFWSLIYSRIGLRHISLPPWIGLAAYSFWRGSPWQGPRSASRSIPTLRAASCRSCLWP
jgi:4-amino-4-deoxy-L-arabinose transferase-like glycosyltransferase